jgi:hypothetical protein
VTASDYYDSSIVYLAKNAADLTVDSHYFSSNAPNQWICDNFVDSTIKPTHYSIRSRRDVGVGDHHLKSWVIECSVDGKDWVEVDRRNNNNELNARNVTRLFIICISGEDRYIRLHQTGPTHRNDHYLVISGLEIFGLLVNSRQ